MSTWISPRFEGLPSNVVGPYQMDWEDTTRKLREVTNTMLTQRARLSTQSLSPEQARDAAAMADNAQRQAKTYRKQLEALERKPQPTDREASDLVALVQDQVARARGAGHDIWRVRVHPAVYLELMHHAVEVNYRWVLPAGGENWPQLETAMTVAEGKPLTVNKDSNFDYDYVAMYDDNGTRLGHFWFSPAGIGHLDLYSSLRAKGMDPQQALSCLGDVLKEHRKREIPQPGTARASKPGMVI